MTHKFNSEGGGDWVRFMDPQTTLEIDLHVDKDDLDYNLPYWEKMRQVWERSLDALKRAQAEGKKFVLFKHGWSTSRIGKTTSRSQVRKLMQSREATPFIIRRNSIKHDTVFLASIRPINRS